MDIDNIIPVIAFASLYSRLYYYPDEEFIQTLSDINDGA